MPCCKGEQYDNWCEGDAIVYTDGDGKEFCVFHAPKGEKQLGRIDFNNEVFKKINQGKYQGLIDLRGTVFEGRISFDKFKDNNGLIEIHFHDAEFQKVTFKETVFRGNAMFIGANFNGEADFTNAAFQGEAIFRSSNFHKSVTFNGNRFVKPIDFSHCTFKEAHFEQIDFQQNISFFKATFGYTIFTHVKFGSSGNVDFNNARFNSWGMFKHVTFYDLADFSNIKFWSASFDSSTFQRGANFRGTNFGKVVHLNSTTFDDYASFAGAKFSEMYLSGAKFNDDAYFNDMEGQKLLCSETNFAKTEFDNSRIGIAEFRDAHFNDLIRFSGTIFTDNADFYNANFKKAVFQGKTFEGSANFGAVKIADEVSFENVNLKETLFNESFIKQMTFVNVTWSREREDIWNLDDRYVLYDEIEVNMEVRKALDRKKFFKKLWLTVKLWFLPERAEELSKVKVLYNTLKQKFKQEHNEAEASNWHYCEKEMLRRTTSIKKNGFMWIVYNLYRYSSGYAEYPLRALLVLIFLILLYGFGLKITGFIPIKENLYLSDLSRPWISAVWDYFIEAAKYASFQKDYYFKPVTVAGEIVKIIGKIAIPVQAALFVMAIRNRFRR